MTRNDILNKAAEIVGGHRTVEYGEPEDNFGIIARLWSAYLGIDISSVDVSMLMVLFKAARVKTGTGTEDSFIDIAGYAACGGEIHAEKSEYDDIRYLPDIMIVDDIRISNPKEFENFQQLVIYRIEHYGEVTVADIYGMLGESSGTYHDHAKRRLYGWRKPPYVTLHRDMENGKYFVRLPIARYLTPIEKQLPEEEKLGPVKNND